MWLRRQSAERTVKLDLWENWCLGIHSACTWQRAASAADIFPSPTPHDVETHLILACHSNTQGFLFLRGTRCFAAAYGRADRDLLRRRQWYGVYFRSLIYFLTATSRVEPALCRSGAYGTIVDELGHLVDHLRSDVLCFYHLWSECFWTTGFLIGLYRHAWTAHHVPYPLDYMRPVEEQHTSKFWRCESGQRVVVLVILFHTFVVGSDEVETVLRRCNGRFCVCLR
jgi:hypothetical protein